MRITGGLIYVNCIVCNKQLKRGEDRICMKCQMDIVDKFGDISDM